MRFSKRARIIAVFVAIAILFAAALFVFKNKIFADTAIDQPQVIFGCNNNADSKCLDLGASEENPSGVSFHMRYKKDGYETSDITINDLFLPQKYTENDFNYKNYQATGSAPEGASSIARYLSFDAFGELDSKGFPIDEYLLEIHYKDVYRNDSSTDGGWDYYERLNIESLINYGIPGQYFLKIGKLLGSNTQEMRYEQIYFPRNSWQRIRAVDGKFSFSLKDAREDRSNPIPIDYIALKKLTSDEARRFTDWQASNALENIAYDYSKTPPEKKTPAKRVDYVENNPQPNISSYTWFSVPSMKPIYPNQYPLQNEIEQPISISSTYGETEPFNFGIYTKAQLNNVSFVKNDLTLKNDPSIKLPKEKISIKKTVYQVKFWGNYLGNIGLQPDYPIDFDKTDISANSSQQFWGEIIIDKGIPAGEYSGTIGLKIGENLTKNIPLTIKVISYTLSDPDRITALYHDPTTPGSNGIESYKLWGTDQVIKQDYIENGITNLVGSLQITVPEGCGPLQEENFKVFKDRFIQLKKEGLIGKTAVYKMSPATSAAMGCVPPNDDWWTRYRDPRFINKFKEILAEVKKFVESNGSEIVLIGEDEPQKLADRNMQVMVTSKIAHDVGIKVWSTYSASASSEKLCRRPLDGGGYSYCEPCNNVDTDYCYKKNGLSYLPGLTNYIDYKAWSMSSINSIDGQDDRATAGFKDTFGYYTTGSLQIRNPIINRFLNSYYAESAEGAGAKIVANWAYVGEVGSDPYNEFDQMPEYASRRYRPDYLLSYPRWNGPPIPTFAMKGLREGIKDSKYIATLKKLIASNPQNPQAIDAKRFLERILDLEHVKPAYSTSYPRGEYGNFGTIVKYLSAGSTATDKNAQDYKVFDENRAQMINYIQALSNANVKNFSFPTGFTAFGTTERFSSNLITSQNLLVYRFDGPTNTWIIGSPSKSFDIEPWRSYLIYNPGPPKVLSLPYTQASSSQYKLTHGWNMLYSSNQKNFDDLSIELPSGQVDGLPNLVSQDKILEYIFKIENQTSQDPCDYYSLLSNNLNPIFCRQDKSRAYNKSAILPAGKSFWVYVR